MIGLIAARSSWADPPGSVEFTADGFSANENGSATVVLIRNSLFGDPFTVDFATHDGTAQANIDYIPTNGTVRFVPGQTNAYVTIQLVNDVLFEGLETFTVELSNPTAGATLAGRRTTTVTILDDESVRPGTLDGRFDPGTGANGTVFAVQWLAGDSVLIGGSFTAFNRAERPAIARLNPDGSLNSGFAPAIMSGETVYALAMQPDQKVIVGGTFTTVGGTQQNRIARLLASGALDTAFSAGTGADDVVRTVTLQGDGRVIVGGQFTHFNDSVRDRIVRLNPDGSIDSSFSASADGDVTSSLIDSSGRIIIGGSFRTVNGTTRVYVARLMSDGSLDEAFNPGGGNTVVNGTGIKTLALQSDGKLIIAGDPSILYGSGGTGIARLLENGDLDHDFRPNVPSGSSVLAVAVQPDGHIIIGGDFFRLADPTCCNLYDRKGIARLNRDGSVDTGFDVGSGVDPIYVTALALQPDFKVLLGGAFTKYNGAPRSGIARLHGDMRTRIESWTYNGAMQITVTNQPGKTYIVEATTNLTDWIPVATNTPSGSTFTFTDTNAATLGLRMYRVRETSQ